jgi:hypothetical protein
MTRIQQLEPCSKCDRPWPLRLSQEGEEAAAWVCANCDAAAIGVFDTNTSSDLHANVRLREAYFDQCFDVPTPDGMKAFADKFAEEWEPYRGNERRRSERVPTATEVGVVPLNAIYSPSGESFSALVSNFSQQGLALINTRTIDAAFIAIAMPSSGPRSMQVIAEVVRCNSRGRFYEIGCELKVRLGS